MPEDSFEGSDKLDRYYQDRNASTYSEVFSDVERTFANQIGENFSALGVQIAIRGKTNPSVRLFVNFTPVISDVSWIGKISLTKSECSGSVFKVAKAPSPLSACCYTVQEVVATYGHIEPHKVIGIFSLAQTLITDCAEIQKAAHGYNPPDDEPDYSLYPVLPSGNALDILEPKADSWFSTASVINTRNMLSSAMTDLLCPTNSYEETSGVLDEE